MILSIDIYKRGLVPGRTSFLIAVCFLLLAGVATPERLQAQDTLGTDEETLLPEIMPREVEILGEFEASFPTFQRQALSGFNPPPPIYQVPRGRIPYREDYRQAVADLPPVALASPRGPSIANNEPEAPNNGEVILSAGRLFSRYVSARIAPPVSKNLALFADGTYTGWSGFKPFTDLSPDLETDTDQATGTVGLKTNGPGISAGVEARGMFRRYDVYGATTSTASSSDVLRPVPQREGVGLGGRAWLRNTTGSDVPFSLTVSYDATRFETAIFERAEVNPALRRAEKRLDAEGFFGGRFSSSMIAIDGRMTVAGLDTDAALSRDHMAFDVGASLRLRFGRKARLTVGSRFLGYDVPKAGDTGFESALYVSPIVELDVFSAPGLQFFLRNRPEIEVHGLRDLYEINPYIVSEPFHKPTVSLVNTEGGVVLFTGPLRLSGAVGYESHPHFLYFESTATTAAGATVTGLFAPRFDDAAILKAGAEIGIALPGGFTSSLSTWWRQGTLGEAETVIPYFPDLVSRLQISASFAEGKGLLKVIGRMSSARWTDRLETTELKGFIDLDAEASYMLAENIGAFGRVNQISEGRFVEWENYPTPPWLISGGIRMQW